MNFKDYKYLILSDLYRYAGNVKFSSFIHKLIFSDGYKYTFWMRTARYFSENIVLKYTLLLIVRLIRRRHKYKYGIIIRYTANIGSGLYIGHYGNIFVSAKCKIGKNCNISNEVTLGTVNRGERKGWPTIGDNVYIGPGAKLIGAVKIGNNVAIGANCVVTKDIPDNAVVCGVPGEILSCKGSEGYVNNIDYEDKISH